MLAVLLVQLRFSTKSAAARDGFSRCLKAAHFTVRGFFVFLGH
jgi:hypothetical protein